MWPDRNNRKNKDRGKNHSIRGRTFSLRRSRWFLNGKKRPGTGRGANLGCSPHHAHGSLQRRRTRQSLAQCRRLPRLYRGTRRNPPPQMEPQRDRRTGRRLRNRSPRLGGAPPARMAPQPQPPQPGFLNPPAAAQRPPPHEQSQGKYSCHPLPGSMEPDPDWT